MSNDIIETLTRRAEWAERQLILRDRAEVAAKAERLAQAQKDEEAKADAAREAAIKTEREQTRVGAWTNHIIDEAARRDPTAPFNVEAVKAAIPSSGWPPGIAPTDFHFCGQAVAGKLVDDVGETSMGKALQALLEQSARVRNAK